MQWFIDGLSWLVGFLWAIVGWFFDSLIYVVKAMVWFFFDGILTFLLGIVQSIDMSAIALNWGAAWVGVPSQVIYLLNVIGFPQCVTIMAAAYAIRLIMNLIPSLWGFSLDKL